MTRDFRSFYCVGLHQLSIPKVFVQNTRILKTTLSDSLFIWDCVGKTRSTSPSLHYKFCLLSVSPRVYESVTYWCLYFQCNNTVMNRHQISRRGRNKAINKYTIKPTLFVNWLRGYATPPQLFLTLQTAIIPRDIEYELYDSISSF